MAAAEVKRWERKKLVSFTLPEWSDYLLLSIVGAQLTG